MDQSAARAAYMDYYRAYYATENPDTKAYILEKLAHVAAIANQEDVSGTLLFCILAIFVVLPLTPLQCLKISSRNSSKSNTDIQMVPGPLA